MRRYEKIGPCNLCQRPPVSCGVSLRVGQYVRGRKCVVAVGQVVEGGLYIIAIAQKVRVITRT